MICFEHLVTISEAITVNVQRNIKKDKFIS